MGFFSWFSKTMVASYPTNYLIWSRSHFIRFMYIMTFRISSVFDPVLNMRRISEMSSCEDRVRVE